MESANQQGGKMNHRTRETIWILIPWIILILLIVGSVIQHAAARNHINEMLVTTPDDVKRLIDERLETTPSDVLARLNELEAAMIERTRDRFTSKDAEKLETKTNQLEAEIKELEQCR